MKFYTKSTNIIVKSICAQRKCTCVHSTAAERLWHTETWIPTLKLFSSSLLPIVKTLW